MSRTIEVFRPGTFTPMSGPAVTLTADDLKALAARYDAALSPAPAVVGHPNTDSPAYGWAAGFAYDDTVARLTADLSQLEPQFEQAVKDGRYKRISLSLFRPEAPNNPKPGTWYPKHIGFLGGAAPAVTGLKPVELSANDDGVVTFASAEFSDPGFKDVASQFRGLRDWLIGKFGLEEADKAMPAWTIGWIDAQGDDDDKTPGFAAPVKPLVKPPEKNPMSNADAAAAAAREVELTRREAALKAQEDKLRHDANASFAETLVNEGRLLPASKVKLISALDALGGTDTSASFAEGGATISAPAVDVIRDILKSQPPVVQYGRADLPAQGGGSASFAAPIGREVDSAGLEVLAKAQAYQAANPKVSFLDSVKAVSNV